MGNPFESVHPYQTWTLIVLLAVFGLWLLYGIIDLVEQLCRETGGDGELDLQIEEPHDPL